jgi:Sulfite oxidase and related enzymes
LTFNGNLRPIPNGAPLRQRIECQPGHDQAKYIQRIEAVDSLARIPGARAAIGKII